MLSFHNIDKSAFRKGQYVGYANGTIWRIKRTYGGWTASNGGQSFTRRTLAEVSKALEITAGVVIEMNKA